MSEPLLEVRDLTKCFPARRGTLWSRGAGLIHAVDGVSLDVQAGETLGLVGETGCGKSTTARLVMRLLEPTSGVIRFAGEDIGHLRGAGLKALRQEVQMIFQDPYSSLNPRKTVGTILADPFRIHGIAPPGGERRAAQALLEQVGLNPHHVNRHPHEFSGGQRQRIGVARAIALKPRLIVADEPVSALDVSIQAQILNLLAQLRRDLGLTILFIAHDLSVVHHLCDRVAVMYLGKVVEVAPVARLYAHPRHPYTAALMSAVTRTDAHAATTRRRIVLRGGPPDPAAPPSGCRFHPRCPKFVAGHCDVEAPALTSKDGATLAACHYPVSDGEDLHQASLADR